VLVGWQPIGIANTCGCRCIHLQFVGCLNKRIFIYLFILAYFGRLLQFTTGYLFYFILLAYDIFCYLPTPIDLHPRKSYHLHGASSPDPLTGGFAFGPRLDLAEVSLPRPPLQVSAPALAVGLTPPPK